MHGLKLFGGHGGYLVGWSSEELQTVEKRVEVKIERRGRKRKRARKLF